jgi:MinD-like ATPase involved in chromosome partitioning or flagellar assembly
MKVHSLLEKGKNKEAAKLLAYIRRNFRKESSAIIDCYLLSAILGYKQDNISQAVNDFLSAKDVIANLNNYNDEEKKYILLYILQWLDFLDAKESLYQEREFLYKLKNKEIVLNLKEISKSLMDYFPVDFSKEIDIEKLIGLS